MKMRILSVAEINIRAVCYRVASPPPRDPMLRGDRSPFIDEEEADEEVAAIMACNPVNVAPLAMYVELGSPEQIYPELEENINDVAWEDPARVQADEEAVGEVDEDQVLRADEEEEAARLRLLRDAEEESEEENEGMEEAEEEGSIIDSGIDTVSIDSDAETIILDRHPEPMEEEEDDDSGSSSDNTGVSESENDGGDKPYDPICDPEREAKLHRYLGLQKHLYAVRQKLLRLKRRRDIERVQNKIRRARERRTRYLATLNRVERRNIPVPQVERPRRNRDFCYGCGRLYLTQRVRWWWRCETCGFWLCPDCSSDPLHCQRNELIN